MAWVKQGIIPLDEALEDRDLLDTRNGNEIDWGVNLTCGERFSALRRLKKFQELARRRDGRRGG